MLEPPISNLGIRGIRKASQCVGQWPNLMKTEVLRRACFNAFVFIDATGGTGGGLFRFMYSRFLQEASAITREKRLSDLSEQMRQLGDDWQRIAATFRQAYEASARAQHLIHCSALLRAVAERENGVWKRLQELAGHRQNSKRRSS
jgi:hypothetical protein